MMRRIALPITIILFVGLIIFFMYALNRRSPGKPLSANIAGDHTQKAASRKQNQMVTLNTSQGDIVVELFTNDVPKTAQNFSKLVRIGVYDGTKIHRVIPGVLLQGGDPLSVDDSQRDFWGTGGPGYQFPSEFVKGYSNVRGTIAMANTGPDTNGSQFFINLKDNPHFDGKYSVFGTVIAGMEIAERIGMLPIDDLDRPIEDIVVESIVLAE